MAVEGDGASVNQHVAIAVDDHTVVVPGHRASALIADARDGTAHHERLRFACSNRSAV